TLAKEPSARREGQYTEVRPGAEGDGSCRERRQPSVEPSSARREPKAARDVRVVHVHRIRGIGGSERHLLTLLPALAERGVGLSPAKVETIHYGVDELPPAWGANPPDAVPAGARVLLAVTRLTRQKGVDVAIRALPSAPADAVLVVLGEGPERASLERLARE